MSLTVKKLPSGGGQSGLGLEPVYRIGGFNTRRVLNWRMGGDPEHPKTPGFSFNPMRLPDQIETVTLLPFGATRLRMAYRRLLSAVRAVTISTDPDEGQRSRMGSVARARLRRRTADPEPRSPQFFCHMLRLIGLLQRRLLACFAQHSGGGVVR